MYTVVKSYGIAKEQNSRWQELNLGSTPVYQIFELYRSVYLELTAAFLTENIYVDIESFRVKYHSFQGTLTDLFTDNGNETLQTIDEIPVLSTKRAYFSDAVYSGYKVQISQNVSTTDNAVLDLKVTRDKTEILDIYKHCIFSVNGFWHMTDMDPDNVYILSGGNTMLKSRDNHLGVWSWSNVGEIEYKKITPSMIFAQNNDAQLNDRAYIDTGIDTTNKTVLLFAGGYLVKPEPGVFFPIGNNIFCFNIGRIPMLRRYYESRQYIDFSDLGLDESTINDSLVDSSTFYSNENIKKYLSLPQSFLVIIDKPNVYFEDHPVRTAPMPGMLLSYYEPVFPLMLGAGRSPSYWKRHENGQWAINIADSYRQNKAFETAIKNSAEYYSDTNQTIRPAFYSKAYLLEAGIDLNLETP